ncbi:hypothetical protein DFQ27_006282 [Actinomortierella ambigua]|uniref:3'-phosphate/5'-hydroxy nucleic acid ligase n=1 Tax=Actinomortierella ambigua TaxID=1343610 RepID=A0A9P6U1C2_9FUNG|nr:hypothetical protein DFQ27_006282 [Actinomortierella ambigua]
MPSTTLRLTLINNAKQTQRSAVLLKLDDQSDAVAEIFTLARNKLRLKRAKVLYLTQGVDVTDKAIWFTQGKVVQDSLVYISCGEAFIGQVAAPTAAAASMVETEKKSSDSATDTSLTLEECKEDIPKTISFAPASSVSVTVLAKKSFVDPEAEGQLKRVSLLPGMRRVVGQPDLHPGQATPVGATFITENLIYPALIGNDIGCGMAVYKTRLSSSIRPQKIVDRLVGLEGPWTEGDPHQFLVDQLCNDDQSLPPSPPPHHHHHLQTLIERGDDNNNLHLDQLGTLGGGNHFAEFVVLDSIVDADLCTAFNITDDKTYLIVHTGSRKFGQTVLDSTRNNDNTSTSTSTHASKDKKNSKKMATSTLGLYADSDAGRNYLAQHNLACQWARANRELVARRVLTRLNAEEDAVKLLDIWHNHVEQKELDLQEGSRVDGDDDSNNNSRSYFIHRKGAAPSDRGLVVIPGSRGHHSYLVMPHDPVEQNAGGLNSASAANAASAAPAAAADASTGNGLFNGFSLAHGAGRQWPRAKALQKRPVASSRQESIAALQTTELGSMVVCEDPNLLLEEQPGAYKDIYDVIHDLLPFAKIVAILRPIATYKMRNEKNRSV